MKKMLCMFLAMILAVSLCSAALADDPNEVRGTVTMNYSGIIFTPPESFRNTAGVTSTDGDVVYDTGINYAYWAYYAMTEDELVAAMNNGGDAIMNKAIVLFYVLSIRSDISFADFNAAAGDFFAEEYVRELGKAGDYTFYLYMEGPNQEFADGLDPAYRDEYTALASNVDDVAAAITIFEPMERPDPNAGLVGSKFEFTTTDIDGNPVSSADLFAQNEVTMVNFWATWCGPCIGELEELQQLHTELQEKGCGIAGMLVWDDDTESARALIAENGMTYPVIWAPESIEEFISLEGVPTTIFVGRDGTVLAAPIVGAYVEGYKQTLETLLAE